VGREEAMRREPTEGRERKYLERERKRERERIPMATHDHRSAGCMLLESASFPARRWSVLVELVTDSSLLVGAEAEEQLCSAVVWCVSRGSRVEVARGVCKQLEWS
jgi:hypothetical protein